MVQETLVREPEKEFSSVVSDQHARIVFLSGSQSPDQRPLEVGTGYFTLEAGFDIWAFSSDIYLKCGGGGRRQGSYVVPSRSYTWQGNLDSQS